MTDKTAMSLVITGLVLCLGGVGGIENSVEAVALIQSMAVAVVGLALMMAGVLAIQVQKNG